MSFRFRGKRRVQGGPAPDPPIVTLEGVDVSAAEAGPGTATIRVTRAEGSLVDALVVQLSVSGSAVIDTDYTTSPDIAGGAVTIPAGQSSVDIVFTPIDDEDFESNESIVIVIEADAAYGIGAVDEITITVTSDDAAPPAAEGHPRIWITADTVTTLRSDIENDVPSGRKARWQQWVTDFESAGGYFANGNNDAYTMAVAAFLAGVRTPSNDLGLTWSYSHAHYITRITTAMTGWNHTGESPFQAAAHPLVYDWIYDYLDANQRADLIGYMEVLVAEGSKIKWISGASHWDDQGTDEHVAKLLCATALEDYEDRLGKSLQESVDWAAAHEFFQMGEGMGYAFKNSVIGSVGPPLSLDTLKRAYSLTDAQTLDLCNVSFRDAVPLLRALAMPHAGYNHIVRWRQVRINFQAPEAVYHIGANIGCNILWALKLLPGKVDLSPGTDHSHQDLATSETAFFGYLRHISDSVPASGWSADRKMIRHATNAKWALTTSPTQDRGHLHVLYSIIPWLIDHVSLPTAVDPETAGIPRIRRWWPDALNWITMIGGTREDSADQSLVVYYHRRWWNNFYTAPLNRNGMWQVFWGCQLLMAHGAASHGPIGKFTESGNGCITFVDLDNYTEFEINPNQDDGGRIRGAETHKTYQSVLAASDSDFGRITHWYSDDDVMVVTSDLTKSYNSTEITYQGAAPKISSFIREFVATQRGADGTDRHCVFTFDRIAVLGSGRYQPRYNLCPPLDPDLDGTETAYEPHYPDPFGRTVSEPFEDKDAGIGWPWKTTGPVRWDYDGAARLIFDGADLPNPVFNGTGPGSGKVHVTWLRPDSSDAVVQKRGGFAQYYDPTYINTARDNGPNFDQFGALRGIDGQWYTSNSPDRYQFVGTHRVQLWHGTFSADTRFLVTAEVMETGQSTSTAAELTCDAGSVAARNGATAVVFSAASGTHSSGNVTIPSGVTYVVLVNLPASTTMSLGVSGTLAVLSAERDTSSSGVLTVSVSGAGTLTFS